MRKFFIIGILILSFVFIFLNRVELESIAHTLSMGNWRYLILAIFIWVVWLFTISGQFRVILLGLGIDEKISKLLFLLGATNFINIVAPSVGVSGLSILVSEARRKGYSSARAAFSGALFLLFDYVGFFLILIMGLFVLFRRRSLTGLDLSMSAVLLIAIIFLSFLTFRGMRSGESLASVLTWMSRQVNRLLRRWIHRDYLSEERAISFAHDASDGLNELKRNPRTIIGAISLAVVNKSLLMIILAMCFLAYKVPFTVGTIIASFSIGFLFMIVSPTPAGLGFFEGGMTLALTTTGISFGTAIMITLTYRAITFWLNLLFGMLSLRIIEHDWKVREIKPDHIVGD